MRSISLLTTLFFSLSWAQLLGASINVLSIPIDVTLLPQPATETTQAAQTPTTTAKQQTTQAAVTTPVQTTPAPQTSVIVTRGSSYAVIPSVTNGAVTLTFNSDTYTISVVDGQTSIYGGKNQNGTSAHASASMIGDQPVIVDPPATTTVFGTSILTTTAAVVTGIATNQATEAPLHKSGSLGVGAGVGIGVGVMALLIVAGLVAAIYLRKRRKQQDLDHKTELMSITSIEGAGYGDDKSSTKPRSEHTIIEKSELDSTSVNIVQHTPVELMGDLPRVPEMPGSLPVSSDSLQSPQSTDRPNSEQIRASIGNELESWLAEETERADDDPISPLVATFSRRATQSSIVSPVSISNSARGTSWPPLPDPPPIPGERIV